MLIFPYSRSSNFYFVILFCVLNIVFEAGNSLPSPPTCPDSVVFGQMAETADSEPVTKSDGSYTKLSSKPQNKKVFYEKKKIKMLCFEQELNSS
jgi:hypothetical protein